MKETKAMKYNLKNKLRNLACVSLLTGGMWGLSACSDYLDVVPDNVGTIEHSFSNRNEAEKYLFTCYSYIPEYHSERANVGLMGGDELATFYPIQSGDDYATWRIGLGYQNVNDPYMNYWDGGNGAAHSLYEGLRDCNTFLTYVSDLNYVGDLAPSMRKRWLAEVKFLKAYYHYLLLRMYGPIVIINENLPISSTPEEVRLKRAPVDKVVAFISDLLDEAKTDLPVKIDDQATELGRITRPAALMLKAKLLVMAASPLFNGNPDYADFTNKDGEHLFSQEYSVQKWIDAQEACEEAIEMCEQGEGGVSPEIVLHETHTNMLFSDRLKRELSLRECVTEKWNDELIWGLSGRPVSGLQQSCMSRVGKYPSNMHGASEKINPTMYVTELYYTKNGIPLDEDKEWEYANRLKVKKNTSNTANEFYLIPDYETVTANFDREPRYYANIGFDGGLWYQSNCVSGNSSDIWQLKGRAGQAQGILGAYGYSKTGYWAKKLVNLGFVNTESGWNSEQYPWPEFRLADLYLLYAEAVNEASDSEAARTLAISYVDKIRERAGLSGVKESWEEHSRKPNKFRTQLGLREIIQRERTIELMFEGQRFWDVRRWKIADKEYNKTLMAWNPRGKTVDTNYQHTTMYTQQFVAPRDYFWPIKEKSLVINPNLVQNPGWQ